MRKFLIAFSALDKKKGTIQFGNGHVYCEGLPGQRDIMVVLIDQRLNMVDPDNASITCIGVSEIANEKDMTLQEKQQMYEGIKEQRAKMRKMTVH